MAWGLRIDASIAAGLATLTTVEIWRQPGVTVPTRVLVGALFLVGVGSLVLRRDRPLVPCGLLAVALIGQAAFASVDFSSLGTAIAIVVALYSVGAYATGVEVLWGVLALAVGLAARELRDLSVFRSDPGMEAFWWLLVLSTAGLGVAVGHQRRATQMRQVAAAATSDAEQQARVAVQEERARIARELHDIVSHGVSAVAVQAEAAEQVLKTDPDRASRSLSTIQSLSRQSLHEMRQLLGILRADETGGATRPPPSLAELPHLVARCGELGLRVDVHVTGQARTLPPGLEASAYRVIQEGLTNVRKHSHTPSASLLVDYGRTVLTVQIVNSGLGVVDRGSAEGHGLIGMRERVLFFGGGLSAGPTEDGFSVEATFPIPDCR